MIRNDNKELKNTQNQPQISSKPMNGSSNAQGPSNILSGKQMRSNGNMAVKRLRGYDSSSGRSANIDFTIKQIRNLLSDFACAHYSITQEEAKV